MALPAADIQQCRAFSDLETGCHQFQEVLIPPKVPVVLEIFFGMSFFQRHCFYTGTK